MKKIIAAFLIVVICIAWGQVDTAASQDQHTGLTEPPEQLLKYFPVEVGDWRQYDRSYWSIPHGSAWVEEIIQSVIGIDTVLDGRLAYIFKDEGVSYDSIWFVFTENELRRYEFSPKDYSDYKVLLKLPLSPGQRWAFSPFEVQGDSVWAYLIDTSATVDVPAGQYRDCLHVFALPFEHYWFHPDLGIVRSSTAEDDSLTGTDDDLMNFEVGP
jgi:hypothetical protein